MRLCLTDEQRAFRERLRQVLGGASMSQAVAQLARTRARDTADEDPRPVCRVLGDHGCFAPDWPQRFGGLGLGQAAATILTEELARAGLPDSAYVNSVRNAGRCLLMFAGDELCGRLLPAMACGRSLMAVLYTEPDSGSDLASLRATARPAPEGWLLSGVKTYSVKTAFCDHALVAARTSGEVGSPRGITLLVVDLHAPGVSMQPIPAANPEPFYRVSFDDVVVAASDVVGPVDAGWMAVTAGLAVERVGVDYTARAQAHLGWLRERSLPEHDVELSERLREIAIRVRAGRMLAWLMAEQLDRDDLDPADAAMSKWLNSELLGELAELAARVDGPYGLLDLDDVSGLGRPHAQQLAREAPGLTLSAGASELMLETIASGLGLGEILAGGGPR